mgnify:CR=1 FL=1
MKDKTYDITFYRHSYERDIIVVQIFTLDSMGLRDKCVYECKISKDRIMNEIKEFLKGSSSVVNLN